LDAAFAFGEMFPIPRPVNSRGYPLEGVYSRFMGWGGRAYVFLVNLRAEPVVCHVWGGAARGRDVLSGRSMELPSALLPLDPVLLELGGASGASAGFAPVAVLSPPDAG
jgi:hypothetical protein